jgi:hypothetical protein
MHPTSASLSQPFVKYVCCERHVSMRHAIATMDAEYRMWLAGALTVNT